MDAQILAAIPLKKNDDEKMTSRQIWTLNFGTTLSFLLLVIGRFFTSMYLRPSDKDIIGIYFIIVLGIYLALLTKLFYERIYKWGTKSRKSFYVMSTMVAIISFIILVQIIIDRDPDATFFIKIFAAISILNITTYVWAQLTKERG